MAEYGITITNQQKSSIWNSDLPKYRVEIKDGNGYGLGYGDTAREAYADARKDYQAYRASATKVSLKKADMDFEQMESER